MPISLAQMVARATKDLQEVKKNIEVSYKATLYQIGNTLVFYTPIDTGLASSNWNVVKEGQSAPAEREPVEGSKGLAALDEIALQVVSLKGGTPVVFVNPVEYIIDLDQGSSGQNRAGMTIPTASRVPDIWVGNFNNFVGGDK